MRQPWACAERVATSTLFERTLTTFDINSQKKQTVSVATPTMTRSGRRLIRRGFFLCMPTRRHEVGKESCGAPNLVKTPAEHQKHGTQWTQAYLSYVHKEQDTKNDSLRDVRLFVRL